MSEITIKLNYDNCEYVKYLLLKEFIHFDIVINAKTIAELGFKKDLVFTEAFIQRLITSPKWVIIEPTWWMLRTLFTEEQYLEYARIRRLSADIGAGVYFNTLNFYEGGLYSCYNKDIEASLERMYNKLKVIDFSSFSRLSDVVHKRFGGAVAVYIELKNKVFYNFVKNVPTLKALLKANDCMVENGGVKVLSKAKWDELEKMVWKKIVEAEGQLRKNGDTFFKTLKDRVELLEEKFEIKLVRGYYALVYTVTVVLPKRGADVSKFSKFYTEKNKIICTKEFYLRLNRWY